jgi:hypothetical protein
MAVFKLFPEEMYYYVPGVNRCSLLIMQPPGVTITPGVNFLVQLVGVTDSLVLCVGIESTCLNRYVLSLFNNTFNISEVYLVGASVA